jgi:hypothetical protein
MLHHGALRRVGLLGLLIALAVIVLPASDAAAVGGGRHHPHRLGLLEAGRRAKETAAHLCEELDTPPPCYVLHLESCARIAPSKVECGVAVRFYHQNDDCVWTFYVFWKHGEIETSEGRSECHEKGAARVRRARTLS